ncbi:polysaccharide deacetylase family protein [Actinoplanes sp. NPDC049599]|uniref:polysaccharide deacetylase family protein n=1 Tax=Actinoplanes sp. NPDC049599 TaxID=3363903 RepID=UPI00379B0753
MRTPKVLVLGLALGLLAGCGPAVTSAAPTTSASSPARSAPAPAAKKPKPPAVPAHRKPVKSKPVRKPAKHRTARAGGPADSLMRTGRAGVALTFDDGPDPVQTPRLLDLLKKERVKATFCVVGRNVAAYPGLVRRIAAEGHTLCNHTWAHSLTLGKRRPAAIRADLARTNQAIRRAAPGAKIKYLRAPGGNFTPAFVRVARELGMTSIYWQVDPRDWEHPKGETGAAHRAKVVRTVKQHVGRGSIVLSHDYRQPETITAYETLLPWLRQRYRLIALP